MVKLGELFARDLLTLEHRLNKWPDDFRQRLLKVHKQISSKWQDEAKRRVPRDVGTLEKMILKNTYAEDKYTYVSEVGTNIPEYPVYLEFGTRYIAQGAVLALGDSTELTDQDAVHMWAAKAEGLTGLTAKQASLNTEQMPWLRPAFNSIRTFVIDSLNGVMTVPPAP